MKKYIALFLCVVFGCSLLSAQGRIDKVIDSMEGKPDVETTYTERRSPKKKKLMATSRIFNFENTYYFEKLRKAFEEERTNSISAVKTKNQMTYRFDDNKGVSTYTLSWTSDRGPFTMVMTWRSSDANDSSFLMDGDCLNIGSGEFSMSVDELLERLNSDKTFCNIPGDWSISRNGQVVQVSIGCENNEEVAKARRHAVEARKEAAKARQNAAKARREAAKARAEARREASKARAEAQRAAAKARREAARARRTSMGSDADRSERIYDLASRSRCRIVSPAGVLTEMSALDALDNDIVWSALEKAVGKDKRMVTSTTVSGSTITVIIEPEADRI